MDSSHALGMTLFFLCHPERSAAESKDPPYRVVIHSDIEVYVMLYKSYYVYAMTNDAGNVLYIGVTNDLRRRCYEHRNGVLDGFTKRYNVHKLVYYEAYNDINEAIAREKQLKGWARKKKDALIKSTNPDFEDLSGDLEW